MSQPERGAVTSFPLDIACNSDNGLGTLRNGFKQNITRVIMASEEISGKLFSGERNRTARIAAKKLIRRCSWTPALVTCPLPIFTLLNQSPFSLVGPLSPFSLVSASMRIDSRVLSSAIFKQKSPPAVQSSLTKSESFSLFLCVKGQVSLLWTIFFLAIDHFV